MTNQSFTLPANVFAAVALAISTDENRPNLNGVCFDGECLVAANGHILTAARIEKQPVPDGTIIPVSKPAVTKAKQTKADTVIWDGAMLWVKDANGGVMHAEPCLPVSETFPDWRRVCPQDAGDTCPGAFAVAVVQGIPDTARVVTKTRNPSFAVRGASAGDPHVVTYGGGPDVFTVAMPVRWGVADDGLPHETTPDWARA